jgi:putative ABC transport system permease protein
MILTVVGWSEGMMEESARRARGAGADVWVRPPGSAAIGLSSAPMPEKIFEFFRNQEHVVFATGSVTNTIGGVNTVTVLVFDMFTAMSGGFKFLQGGPFTGPDDIIVRQALRCPEQDPRR